MGRRLAAALVAAVLALPACGGSDGEEPVTDEERAADNLAGEILRSGTVTGQDSVTAAEAGCIADQTVEDVGLDRLQHYGIVTDDLKVDKTIQGVVMERTDADALAGVFVECIETEEMFEAQFLEGKGARRLTPKQRRCIEEVIDEPTVLESLSLSFQGKGAKVYAGLRDQLKTCAPPRRRR